MSEICNTDDINDDQICELEETADSDDYSWGDDISFPLGPRNCILSLSKNPNHYTRS
jgi:hypothetical protein